MHGWILYSIEGFPPSYGKGYLYLLIVQRLGNFHFHIGHFIRWFKSLNDISLMVYKELGEIPLNIWILVKFRVFLPHHVVEKLSQSLIQIKSTKSLF